MLTVHGTLDSLTPLVPNTELYAELVAEQHRTRNHRVYVIEGGQHVDGFVPLFPGHLRPILPCYRDAFTRLEEWVEEGEAPPASGYVSMPSKDDLVNTCDLATAH